LNNILTCYLKFKFRIGFKKIIKKEKKFPILMFYGVGVCGVVDTGAGVGSTFGADVFFRVPFFFFSTIG
jgi:hypothetical protein